METVHPYAPSFKLEQSSSTSVSVKLLELAILHFEIGYPIKHSATKSGMTNAITSTSLTVTFSIFKYAIFLL